MDALSKAPLVSVIVRTRDRPRMLAGALASIAAQSHRPIEVVLVNDGGQTPDLATLRRLLDDVSLVALDLAPGRGRAQAANAGIARASGRWIAFLDDDDEWLPGHLRGLVDAAQASNACVVYAGAELAFASWSEEQGCFEVHDRQTLSKDFSWPELLLGNYIPFNTVLIDAARLRALGGIDESFELYEDWDLLIRLARAQPFVHLDATTARYHQWSQSQQINRASADAMAVATRRIFDKHRADITAAVLLAYRNRRDEQLRHALDAAAAAARDATQQVREDAARQAAEEAARHAAAIASMQALVDERAARILWLEALTDARDAHIRHLEDLQALRQAAHDAQWLAQEHRIAALQAEIAAMRATSGWRLLEKLRRVRSRLLPHGTLRGRAFDLGLRGLMATRRDGVAAVASRVAGRLAAGLRRIPALAGRTLAFARRHGVQATVLRMHDDLVRGGPFVPGVPPSPKLVHDPSYAQWLAARPALDDAARQRLLDGLARRPTISIVTPVYNVDPQWLARCIESVRAQSYPRWQLCLHDDASTRTDTRMALRGWATLDPRIVVTWSRRNGGISAASNAALARATGDFIALLDNDDELDRDALLEVAALLDRHPDTDLVYSDEDRITQQPDGSTLHHDPFFKPEWSPQLLLACMYTGHLSVYRRSLVTELGGFRTAYDFSQDYDLALRVTERTDRIRHLPKVLYHWRTLPSSAAGGGKDFARASNIAALQDACRRRGYDAVAEAWPCANRVHFRLPADQAQRPLVSIVIPTDNRDNLFNCIDLLKQHTDYRPYEIVAVTHSALGRELLERHAGDDTVRLCPYDRPFNFSAKCNEGAAAARGDYLLFFNDDVEATHGSWLEDMLGVFGRGKVGGVSPKLFYENDTLQYAGMVTGVRGLVGTAFHAQPKDSSVHFNFAQSERDVSLLSGACLLMPRRVFDEIGGWDEKRTPIMHSDVDLCCRIRERGYAMVYTPFAALRHIGHLSLKATDHLRERRKDKADTYLVKRFGHYLSHDPWYPESMRAYLYHAGHLPYRMDLVRQDDALLAAADILLVSHDLSLSGAPILLLQLATHFRARGHFVTVISPLDGELSAAYRARGIPVIVDATISGQPDGQTAKLMAAFDLILANTIVAWPSVQVAEASGTPVLWLLHESMAGREMALANPAIVRALAAADDVVFACAATRRLYEDLGDGDHFHVIPYGTRAPEPAADVVRDPARFTVVHIGSIEPRKGQDLLIDAVARLPNELRVRLDVQLIGRVLDPDFHARIRPALEGTPGVRHLGPLPHEAAVRQLAAADLLVCPSRDEVFPVTILEAMALGRPVLSTAVGGVPEMVRDGIDGLVVPPLDAQVLADALATLMQDPARCEAMGQAARQHYLDAFTIDRLGDRLLALIEPRLPAPAQAR